MERLEEQIEQIVREVVARLASQPLTTQVVRSTTGESSRNSNFPATENGSTAAVEIESKVISLADLDGRLNGTKQLVLRRGAVVTPAARDLLRQSGVDVSYRVAEKRKDTARVGLIVGMTDTGFEPSALLSLLRQDGAMVEQIASSGLLGVVDEMTDHVARGGKQGLLLTGQTMAAICVANRVKGVRAVGAQSVRDVHAAMVEVGVNLLVVDPARLTQFEMRRMVAELQRGKRNCPPTLASRLGP